MLYTEYKETDLETIFKLCLVIVLFIPEEGMKYFRSSWQSCSYIVFILLGETPNNSWSSESPITTAVGLDSFKKGQFATSIGRHLENFTILDSGKTEAEEDSM